MLGYGLAGTVLVIILIVFLVRGSLWTKHGRSQRPLNYSRCFSPGSHFPRLKFHAWFHRGVIPTEAKRSKRSGGTCCCSCIPHAQQFSTVNPLGAAFFRAFFSAPRSRFHPSIYWANLCPFLGVRFNDKFPSTTSNGMMYQTSTGTN